MVTTGVYSCTFYSHLKAHPVLTAQGQRLASLNKFKSGHVRILVATDVASRCVCSGGRQNFYMHELCALHSRGLDIPTVDVVVNVNIPANSKDYIHRVGRTARAGVYVCGCVYMYVCTVFSS